MNDFNVLLAAATNGTPSGSLFDALFARYIAPQESWRELESPLPITILAAGEDLIDYRIFGNTVGGKSVGERTENLWDGRANVTEQTYEIEPNMPYVVGKYPPLGAGKGKITLTIYDSNMNQLWSEFAFAWATFTSPSDLSDAKYAKVIVSGPPFTSYFFGKTGFNYNNYIPYGYQLPMVVRSRNLFDGQGTDNYGYYSNDNGRYVNSKNYKYWRFPVKEGDIIRWTTTGAGYGCYFSNGVYKGRFINSDTPFTVPADVDEITNNFEISAWNSAIVTLNQPLPDQYIPYYRDEENIYIGSDPLAEDEYVDFGEQKVYKRTENEVDMSPDKWEQGSFNTYGIKQNSSLRIRQKNVQNIEPNSEYTMVVFGAITGAFCLRAVDGTTFVEYTNWKSGTYTFTTPADAYNIEFTIRRTRDEEISVSDLDGSILILLIKGSTTPSTYIPYLQPTDPPVPIPALPTIEGETIIDYNPSETPAVEPEKMYIKYKPR